MRGKFRFSLVLAGAFLIAFQLPLFPQDFKRGAILDGEVYNKLPRKAELLSRAYTALPARISLKQYAPFPGDQTDYGSCVAWASAYAARTISESIAVNRRDRTGTTGNVFSPAYVYKNITDDPECQNGAMISWALDFFKDKGPARILDSERKTDFRKIDVSLYAEEKKYPIADYVILFDSDADDTKNSTKITKVKKSLAEGKPVIIGMNTPNSFINAKDVWQPRENGSRWYGGHAMCVVGYDDDMDGGCFEVQNSWGKKWGNAGFIWIHYEDFARFVPEAYEMIENLAAFEDGAKYSGFAGIELYNSGDTMPVNLTEEGFYKTTKAWPSGTEFRFILGNSTRSYVYAFAADSSGNGTSRIFPADNATSPILDYAESAIAWPGEHRWIKLDDTAGTDYLVVLFSKQALDLDRIRSRFAEARGSFSERAAEAAGPSFIGAENVHYEQNEIRFTAESQDSKSVFGLLLAIEHVGK
jgi:hypothetical protein